jgi:hypothetical protein
MKKSVQSNYGKPITELMWGLVKQTNAEGAEIYVKRLRMFDVMQTWPRYVLSKLVQFRTGHALVEGWFKD